MPTNESHDLEVVSSSAHSEMKCRPQSVKGRANSRGVERRELHLQVGRRCASGSAAGA